jgi:hypothetical protein
MTGCWYEKWRVLLDRISTQAVAGYQQALFRPAGLCKIEAIAIL